MHGIPPALQVLEHGGRGREQIDICFGRGFCPMTALIFLLLCRSAAMPWLCYVLQEISFESCYATQQWLRGVNFVRCNMNLHDCITSHLLRSAQALNYLSSPSLARSLTRVHILHYGEILRNDTNDSSAHPPGRPDSAAPPAPGAEVGTTTTHVCTRMQLWSPLLSDLVDSNIRLSTGGKFN